MKKIGILTHYHDTVNYGGALQAYALCKVIESFGYSCEQIDIDCFAECVDLDYKPSFFKRLLKPILPIYKIFRRLFKYNNYKSKLILRNTWRNSFFVFNNTCIPHTDKQFNSKNISDISFKYDAFVVGSDQVWNPIWYFEPFFLTFVPDSKPKIAYAASIAQNSLSEHTKETFARNLKNFSAISVREKSAVTLLNNILSQDVQYTLDPTMLLDVEQWEKIAVKNIVDVPYVFCYFLGNDKKMREAAMAFSSDRGLILVNIAHATAQFHTNDIDFGDIIFDAPTPNEFLSLIKNADYIFTDSFHATAFSYIFKKQYFVFERENYSGMSSRVKSLLDLFGLQNRLCDTSEQYIIDYIKSLSNIDYSENDEQFFNLKECSLQFLKDSLKSFQ